jgi:hypothetical protein
METFLSMFNGLHGVTFQKKGLFRDFTVGRSTYRKK